MSYGFLPRRTLRRIIIRYINKFKNYIGAINNVLLAGDVCLSKKSLFTFRVDATGKSKGTMIWGMMKRFYDNHREYFMDHYHKRSNAETVFSMMKRKFGHKLYSKSEVGQVNEILCKALAHNICVLIQEYYEIDIKLNFKECEKLKVAK